MKKIVKFIRLLLIFLMEFLIANLSITYLILFKKTSSIHPQLVEYPTPDLSPTERIILAQMITLTPGTITCKINHEKKKLLIHILDTNDPDEVLEHITRSFKTPLCEVNE